MSAIWDTLLLTLCHVITDNMKNESFPQNPRMRLRCTYSVPNNFAYAHTPPHRGSNADRLTTQRQWRRQTRHLTEALTQTDSALTEAVTQTYSALTEAVTHTDTPPHRISGTDRLTTTQRQ